MHRIDADAHVSNQFDPGDPLVPRLPTQVDHHWLNAVQEEIANAIHTAGVALVKGTNTQLTKILGLLGSGNPAPGDRFFSGMIDIFRSGSDLAWRGLRATMDGGPTDIAALVQGLTTATALKATSVDGPAVHAVSTGTGPAIKAQGYVDFSAAELSTVRLSNYPSIPAVAAEGTVIYVAGTLHRAYVSDGSAWNALW